jgi:hypothetical protein
MNRAAGKQFCEQRNILLHSVKKLPVRKIDSETCFLEYLPPLLTVMEREGGSSMWEGGREGSDSGACSSPRGKRAGNWGKEPVTTEPSRLRKLGKRLKRNVNANQQ